MPITFQKDHLALPTQTMCEPSPCEVRNSESVLNGFSLGLFQAKTALRRWRLHAPRRRKNIAETSGRASSSPSPTQPASGALPPSRARPPTSSCLASSRGKSKCPATSRPAWEFLLLLPLSLLHSEAGSVCAMLSISQALGTQQGTNPSKVSTLGVSHSGRETSSKGKSKWMWYVSVMSYEIKVKQDKGVKVTSVGTISYRLVRDVWPLY